MHVCHTVLVTGLWSRWLFCATVFGNNNKWTASRTSIGGRPLIMSSDFFSRLLTSLLDRVYCQICRSEIIRWRKNNLSVVSWWNRQLRIVDKLETFQVFLIEYKKRKINIPIYFLNLLVVYTFYNMYVSVDTSENCTVITFRNIFNRLLFYTCREYIYKILFCVDYFSND